jgi:single-stranded-DNA-specific exonuclease
VGSGDVGFRLGPRLNAAGRMGDASRALRLLLTEDAQEAAALAAELDQENARRQAVEMDIQEECLRLLAGVPLGSSVVIGSEGWHPGVIGIVASRLVEAVNRPAIVLAEEDGFWRGSARGIKGLHVFEALTACGHLLERFGGHRQAGGMVVGKERLEAFRAAFEAYCGEHLSEADLVPVLALDMLLPLEAVSSRLLAELGSLEPFGVGNPRPVFAVPGVRALSWRRMQERHLRASFGCGRGKIEAVGFGLWAQEPRGPVDIAFQPEMNEFRGNRSLRLNLKAIRPAEEFANLVCQGSAA